MKITIPLRLESLSNLRECWQARMRRADSQRRNVATVCRIPLRPFKGRKDLRITLTRIGPRRLDDGNLAAAFKHVQDGVADAIGIDDRDARWIYEQRKGKYAVEVEVEVEAGFGGE